MTARRRGVTTVFDERSITVCLSTLCPVAYFLVVPIRVKIRLYLPSNLIKGKSMKKTISTFLLMSAVSLFVPTVPAAAASSIGSVSIAEATDGLYAFEDLFVFEPEFNEFAGCPRGTFRVRKSTRTKKKLLNSAISGGIGAAIGGGLGGGRGALLGAGIGAGSYLTYRYIKDRRGRCVRVRA